MNKNSTPKGKQTSFLKAIPGLRVTAILCTSILLSFQTQASTLNDGHTGIKPVIHAGIIPVASFIIVSDNHSDLVSGEAMISLHDLSLFNNTISIYDLSGRMLISKARLSGNAVRLDVHDLNPGTYIIKTVRMDGSVQQNKITVIDHRNESR